MASTIKCPHCGRAFEMTSAVRLEVEEKLKKSIEEKLKKEINEKNKLELQDLKEQIKERDQKVENLQKQELELRAQKRVLEDKEKEMELELQRKLDKEKAKIEEETLKKATQEHRLADMEKEKKIDDLKRQLEDALRRAKTGSQQLQGEVLELDLQQTLMDAFANDDIGEVGKGIKGADVRQIVKSPKGFICGVILWETKRTKAWTDKWITKLKSDLRAEQANIAVIVSSALPDEAKSGFGLKDGVWIVGYNLILPLASLLRKNLLDLGFEKAVQKHKGSKSEEVYEYITSHEFRQQLESLVEVYSEMNDQIEKEKRAYDRLWKVREGQMKRFITSTASIAGSIQGRAGQSALQIKGLDLLEDGK